MAGKTKIGSPEEDENKLRRILSLISSGDLPVGVEFRPTDEERMRFLDLKNKHSLEPIYQLIIQEVQVYAEEPWVLAAKSSIPMHDPLRYFFSKITLKYSNGPRRNRTTPSGHWKITGEERKIKLSGSTEIQGKKQTLVFYMGSGSGCVRTDWIIHEYSTINKKDAYVLCCLFWKPEEKLPTIGNDGSAPTAGTAQKCKIVASSSTGMITENTEKDVNYEEEHCLSYFGSGRLGPEDYKFTDEIYVPEDQLGADADYFDSIEY